MKIAKFMLRFKNKMLPISFVNYYNTGQKVKIGYCHHLFNSDLGENNLITSVLDYGTRYL